MKYKPCPRSVISVQFLSVFIFSATAVLGQCKEKISESTRQNVHYHDIKLSNEGEFLTLTRSGKERLFSYNNTNLEIVYHVRMFTEVRFFSSAGNFSLYTAKSERAPWQPVMILSTPITPKEIQQMKEVERIEIILPEEKRVFLVSSFTRKLLEKALACMN